MKARLAAVGKYAILFLLALVILVPFWDMIINSFKTADEAASPGIGLPTRLNVVENYATVLRKANVLRSFRNSLFITVTSVTLTVAVSTGAAFVFGRRRERWVRFLFYLFLIGIMTPPSIILTVLVLKAIGLLGSFAGIILFYTATYCPLPVFLLTGFMSTVPREIEESAFMDGATPFGMFVNMVLPLLRPAIATSFIYIFLKVWNDFLYPLFVLAGRTSRYTLILNLYFFKGQFYTQWNLVFAFLVLVSLPVLLVFVLAQGQIAEGMTAGAVKG